MEHISFAKRTYIQIKYNLVFLRAITQVIKNVYTPELMLIVFTLIHFTVKRKIVNLICHVFPRQTY